MQMKKEFASLNQDPNLDPPNLDPFVKQYE